MCAQCPACPGACISAGPNRPPQKHSRASRLSVHLAGSSKIKTLRSDNNILVADFGRLLRGKKKPYFAPNVDCGDNVIIINADKVHISSNKREREMRYRHSGYPGGLKTMSLGRSLELHPERVIEEAVKGMMPHNKLSRASIKKLRVFAGPEHTFEAQKPETYESKQVAQ